jgi:5'-nucleotidase
MLNSAAAAPQLLFGTRVVIPDKELVRRKLRKFQDEGTEKLSIISDFDYTMSKFWKLNVGERGASCHKVLEDCDFISPDYKTQAQGLQKKYYPLEVDPTLDDEARTKYMIEWVTKAHQLLIEHRLTKEIIKQAADEAVVNQRIRLRPKLFDFYDYVRAQKVPLLIFSASIAEVMKEVLSHFVSLDSYPDLYIIANRCIWNESGPFIKTFQEPLIHVFNKKASSFYDSPFFHRPDSEQRHNIVLIGDSLGDVTMSEGIPYTSRENILRIGFLNDRVERMPSYQSQFDIIILDDPGFDVPLGIVQTICDNLDLSSLSE